MSGTEQQRRRYAKRSVWLKSLKDKPCADCGGRFPPAAMDWHHEQEKTKTRQARSFNRNWSEERILNEISRCSLVCANCHRIRHHPD